MSLWAQYFPPSPTFTEANIGPQRGKVFLITGGASGVGFELASMLYASGARIYIAGRSEKKGLEAIAKIKQEHDSIDGAGALFFLPLDLSDLATVAKTAEDFLQHEHRLDVLWNNAGVGPTFNGEESAQGLPIQLATNCVGPMFLTQLLQPALEQTTGSRVVWTGSVVIDQKAPKGGMLPTDFERPGKDGIYNYTASKVGNWFLASEFARRAKTKVETGSSINSPAVGSVGSSQLITTPVLHVVVNPGNLRTPIWRTFSWLFIKMMSMAVLYDARFGAYAMLWAGLSPELDAHEDNGLYIIPWGRRHTQPRDDILASLKTEAEGGNGLAARFYEWCETQCREFR